MADANSQSNSGNGGTGNEGGTNNGASGDGSGDGNQGSSSSTSTSTNSGNDFNPESLTPEQLNQVLEKNPHIWRTERLSGLRDKAKKFDDAQAAADTAEQKRLTDEGKFKELSEKQAAENASLKEQVKSSTVNQALTNKLAPLGVVNLEDALKLVDRSKIEVSEDGTISGIEAAVDALKTDKAYLFNGQGGKPNVGSATNSNNEGGDGSYTGPTFKRSQLRDAKFYQEHRDDILKAQAAGKIEDDIGS